MKLSRFLKPGNSKRILRNEPVKESTESTGLGEFEGKYIVGSTSCTVKPVKMAFEIKWAKGSGTEMFFPAGEHSFESEAGTSGINRFEFNDENYNSGTFFRGDGKTFPIKRAK